MLRFLLVGLVLLLSSSGVAAGASVRLGSRDEALGGAEAAPGALALAGMRVLPARAAPFRFDLVGLHWRGSGDVEFRTGALSGPWSPWHAARPEGEDGPDPGSPEAARLRGWNVGDPWWTGGARRIQYRLRGRVFRLRAYFISSAPAKRASLRTDPTPLATPRRLAVAARPRIISRRAWRANERIVRGSTSYADRLAFAVVHHTAGATPATPEESAAIVRAIQAYHVRSNGWNDIGYNFLVDRFGQVFEGRRGGVGRNVVGAHAQGFNTGSVGVAVIGTYESSRISTGARSALVSLLAWRLDVAHVNPASRLSWTSGGNPRYAAGTRVRLNAISAHRDTGFTSCPGAALYRQLGGVRTRVAGRGLPKLYHPVVTGALGGPVRFRARLSAELPWRVAVVNYAGARVALGAGRGSIVDWTWNSAGAPPGLYFYEMRAAAPLRPATGSLGRIRPFAFGLAVTPRVVTPNADGVRDAARVRLSLTMPALVALDVRDANGKTVATLARRSFRAGTSVLRWRGASADGTPVPDGHFRIVGEASHGNEEVRRSAPLVVDRTLAALQARPRAFSPNGDGRRDALALTFALAREASVRVRIWAEARPLATVFTRTLPAGPQTFVWDGRLGAEGIADGRYEAGVAATTALGTRRLAQPVFVDTVAPRLAAVSAEERSGGTLVRFTLSERARVIVSAGAESYRFRRRAGRRRIWAPTTARYVSLVARDAAWNQRAAVVVPVERRE